MIFTRFRRTGSRNRAAGPRRLLLLGPLLIVTGLPATVAAATTPVKIGYYADIIKVRSAEVTFHLRAHNVVPDLAVICENPTNARWLAGTAEGAIYVHMPKETLHGDEISYSGRARISAGPDKTVGTGTVHINLRHVNGPVLRYTFEGLQHRETRAWVGTVSTSACKSLPLGGQATLYGPVSGE